MSKKIIYCFCLLLLYSTLNALPPESEINADTQPLSQIDNTALINANLITMFVTNHGNLGRDLSGYFGYDFGTWYPISDTSQIRNNILGSAARSPMYASGVWLGGKVNGEVRVAISEYATEFTTGPMINGTFQPDQPAFRNYKLYSDSLLDNPNYDFEHWPINQGATLNSTGSPDMKGDQMLWTVYNDADPNSHQEMLTNPLGIEIQQTVYAFNDYNLGIVWTPAEILTVLQDGSSIADVSVELVYPEQFTGHSYDVNIYRDQTDNPYWELFDQTLGITVLANQTNFSGDDSSPIVDGYRIRVNASDTGFGGFSSFECVANGGGQLDPPEPAAFNFREFPVPPGSDGNGYINSLQQIGDGRWAIHTGDNGGSSGGGTRGSYEAFIERTLRNDPERMSNTGQFDYEMRFTGTNDNPGVNGGYAFEAYGSARAYWVPFELWRIGRGTPDDPTDDLRLIPWMFGDGGSFLYYLSSYGSDADGTCSPAGCEHSASGGDNDPYTDWVYWRLPVDESGIPYSSGTEGYDNFEAVAVADPLMTTWNAAELPIMDRTVLINWNGGDLPPFNQDLPEVGTVFRIVTEKGIQPASFHFTQVLTPEYQDDPQGSSLYIQYKLYNKGTNNISDFYFSFWGDPDVGNPSDDFVGCDTLSDIFFSYNATPYDNNYGAEPPVIGYKYVHGLLTPSLNDNAVFENTTISGFKNLGMTAFTKYFSGTDPDNADEVYQYMLGMDAKSGIPYVYDGDTITYMHSGDPINLTGDLDIAPSDRRFMATCGPVSFNPGDSQFVLIKMAVSTADGHRLALNHVRDILNAPQPLGPPVLKTNIQPNPVFSFMQFSINNMSGAIILGYDAVADAGKPFNLSSLVLNNNLPIDSVTVISSPVFNGQPLKIYFPLREFIQSYGSVTYGQTEQIYTLTGQYSDGEPFSIEGTFTLRSHRAGDFNLDNSLDISDLVAWVAFSFNEGEPPAELSVLDMDNNQSVDISDLVIFIHYMFD